MQRASCLSCHRRKLKCSRDEAGCTNCRKTEHTCEYPAAESRARGKRGPYQKRATKRERDLGQELKMTEAKYRQLANQLEEQARGQPTPSMSDVREGSVHQSPSNYGSSSTPFASFSDFPIGGEAIQSHPPMDQMLQLWHVFVTKVDPMTKILHRPSFEKKLFEAKTQIHDLDDSLTTLMYSIYYAAVRSTNPKEAQLRFGESRDVLTERFEAAMEKRLATAQMSSTPDFMTLQALVLYICTLRRQEGGQQLWPLFGLAVRTAQLLKLGSSESDSGLSPLEVELRRRVWWMLSWLEKRCAEDVASQPASIMTWSSCPFPLNVNDDDLDPNATELPQPRPGVTDMTFCLMRFEMLKLFFDLFSLRPDGAIRDSNQRHNSLTCRKDLMLAETRSRLQTLYLQHCSCTRPFDWLIMTFSQGFLSKAELLTRKSELSDDEAFFLSLVVLRCTYLVQTDPRADNWSWIFRDFVQSHALIKVVSELCKGANSTVDAANISDAWSFIEQIVDRIPSARLRGPAVSPIVTLMALARQSRVHAPAPASTMSPQHIHPLATFQAPVAMENYNTTEPLQAFPDAWVENGLQWGTNFLNAAITTPESAYGSDPSAQSPHGTVHHHNVRANSFVWPTTDFLITEPSLNNVDWSQWDSSLAVFDTRFPPGPA